MKVNYLKKEFEDLQLKPIPLRAQEKIKLEQTKLAVYQKLERGLNKITRQYSKEHKEKKNKFKRLVGLRVVMFYFLLMLGLIEDAVGSFIFAQNLLSAIPFMPPLLIIIASLIVVIINCTLFYAFDAAQFKAALGIAAPSNERKLLIEIYQQQVILLERINQMMLNTYCITHIEHPCYQQLVELVLLLNADIEFLQQSIGSYHEAWPRTITRWFVTGFGALMCLAGTYFMATILVALLPITLMTTPIGWGLIGLMMIASLGFYFSMQGRGMMHMFNPEYDAFKLLKKSLKRCDCKSPADFEVITVLQTFLLKNQFNLANEQSQTEAHLTTTKHKKAGSLRFFDSQSTSGSTSIPVPTTTNEETIIPQLNNLLPFCGVKIL